MLNQLLSFTSQQTPSPLPLYPLWPQNGTNRPSWTLHNHSLTISYTITMFALYCCGSVGSSVFYQHISSVFSPPDLAMNASHAAPVMWWCRVQPGTSQSRRTPREMVMLAAWHHASSASMHSPLSTKLGMVTGTRESRVVKNSPSRAGNKLSEDTRHLRKKLQNQYIQIVLLNDYRFDGFRFYNRLPVSKFNNR